MQKATLLFPHQLFKNIDLLPKSTPVFLVEETLFFNQYNFHKQKLLFHRATMKFYEKYLTDSGFEVQYVEAKNKNSDVRKLIIHLIAEGLEELHIFNPTDNWLEKRIANTTDKIKVVWYDNPLFLNTKEELSSFFKATKKKFFQTSFYKAERKKRDILMIGDAPQGGKWTFDTENRKKYPRGKTPPIISFPDSNKYYEEAFVYVNKHFVENIGEITSSPIYPTTYKEAEQWLQNFFETRFFEFGDYEDAIVKNKHFLNHSVLSPLINVGLLSVKGVVKKSIEFANKNDVPINSLEGFIRQIIGWREFIRGVYEVKGTEERTKNFWQHSRKIPTSFYNGTTGIEPIDATIKKTLKTGYAHHIERLMILGNFMVLCEFDPDEVYRWFMELFIDAYDWVMVPNVYGMSLFADGGLMSTKPYISSSNYIKKMSDYKNGDWQQTWDGLFWNFMDKHRAFFKSNPRLSMLINNFDKMDEKKRAIHLQNAQSFLSNLDNELTSGKVVNIEAYDKENEVLLYR